CVGLGPARGEAAHRLSEHVLAALVTIGAGGAVPAAEGVDQARVDRAQVVVAEAEPLHHAGPEVVHQNVGLAGEPIDRLTTERRADVDRDAALVAIQAPEHGTLAARVFHVHAGEIAGARPLDLDDVGAEVAQHLRRARPQLDLGEVETVTPPSGATFFSGPTIWELSSRETRSRLPPDRPRPAPAPSSAERARRPPATTR